MTIDQEKHVSLEEQIFSLFFLSRSSFLLWNLVLAILSRVESI